MVSLARRQWPHSPPYFFRVEKLNNNTKFCIGGGSVNCAILLTNKQMNKGMVVFSLIVFNVRARTSIFLQMECEQLKDAVLCRNFSL